MDAPRRLRVLIVDDDLDTGESLALLLRIPGHDTRHVLDGHDALAVAAEWKPDVVLLDLGMPLMDGFEVARRLRANPDFAATRLFALSGYGSDEDRRNAKAAGFDGHLMKPVEFAVLRTMLAAIAAELGGAK